MLKKLGQFFAVGAMLCGLVLFQGCGGDDITAPEGNLDESGNPAGTGDMHSEGEDHSHAEGEGHDEGAAEAPAEGAAEAPAEGAAEAPAEGDGN
jgi:hypothetical protein